MWAIDESNDFAKNFPLEKIRPQFKFAKDLLLRYNCSFKGGKFPRDMFFHFPNGTYTGPIGMIQRNEVDTMLYPVRPDSLPFTPGLIGPTILPADATIIYYKPKPIRSSRELTSFVTDFPGIVYAYLVIGLFIFVVFFLITEKGSASITEELKLKKLLCLCEEAAYSLLGQIPFVAETISGRIILTILFFLVFFFVDGLFLSKLGVDLIITRVPYKIESIEELIQNNSQTKPIITKQFFLMNLMKQAHIYHRNSTLGRMYKVIQSDQKNLTLDFDPTQTFSEILSRYSTLITKVESRKFAYVTPKSFFQMFNRLNCLLTPKFASELTLVKETFAHGLLTVLFSSEMDPRVRKMLQYFITTIRETSLLSVLESIAAEVALSSTLNTIIDTDVVRCQDQFRDNAFRIEFKDDANQWRIFFLYDYKYVFQIAAGIIALATIIFILEILLDLITKTMKRVKRRKRIVPKVQLQPRKIRRSLGLEFEKRNDQQCFQGLLVHRRHSL